MKKIEQMIFILFRVDKPAAAFAQEASQAWKLESNLEMTEISGYFDKHFIGPASEQVTTIMNLLLEAD